MSMYSKLLDSFWWVVIWQQITISLEKIWTYFKTITFLEMINGTLEMIKFALIDAQTKFIIISFL